MPVYTHLVDHATLGLGLRVRQYRQRRGWTLNDLASKVSTSVATLSTIENQKSSPNVALLFAISQALGVSLDALLLHGASRHFHIARHGVVESNPPAPLRLINPVRRRARSYHNRLWPLAEAFVGRHIEPFEIEVQPLPDERLQFITHNQEEFFFVLRGEIECLIKSPDGLLRETLRPGDCMYFWSYLPHCIRSRGPDPARSIHVLYSPHEQADSESGDGTSGPVIYLLEAPHRNVVDQIAGKINSLRQTRGMSAAEFAQHVGISVRRLARIESGQRAVPLDLLLNICRTFRKPVEYFLAGTTVDRPFSYVFRASQIRRPAFRPGRRWAAPSNCLHGSMFQPLAEGFEKRGMHPYLVTLNSTGTQAVRLQRHPGREFLYVLQGTVTLKTMLDGNRVTETLRSGDSCFIDSSAPHRFTESRFNPYDRGRSEAIVVCWHPPDVRG